MDNLQVFENSEFGKVRTLEINDKPYFVGKDVAEILGYAKPLNALSTHVDEDDSLKQGIIDSMGRKQETILINESGLYSLILSSKLPNAKKFKRWVTSEVLPAIRKQGSYNLQDMSPEIRAVIVVDRRVTQIEQKAETLRQDFEEFKSDMPILGIEECIITNAVRRKGIECMGGKRSNAYQDRSLRGKVYTDIYQELKRQFGVSTYKALRRNQSELALQIVENYRLPVVMADEIREYNMQLNLNNIVGGGSVR